MAMKKILIVDDSVVYRHSLLSALSDEKSFQVVGTAKNGQEALDFILKNSVDLITVDIEMPVMNGHELITRVMLLASRPKMIVFTSLDISGAGNALKALEQGAEDFVTKIEGSGDISKSIDEIKSILIPKIKSLLGIKPGHEEIPPSSIPTPPLLKPKLEGLGNFKLNKRIKGNYNYICIGSSTGGPEALRFLFDELRGKKLPPIFIVQHMPPVYTAQLAKNLSMRTDYKVVEAKHGDKVEEGVCYIAPGDYHMCLSNFGDGTIRIALNQEEKECFVRPSVNQLFRSSKELVENCLYIVLTGMGNDGAQGIEKLLLEGKKPDVLIQNEETSVVWGMPGSLYEKGYFSDMKSLRDIKEDLKKII